MNKPNNINIDTYFNNMDDSIDGIYINDILKEESEYPSMNSPTTNFMNYNMFHIWTFHNSSEIYPEEMETKKETYIDSKTNDLLPNDLSSIDIKPINNGLMDNTLVDNGPMAVLNSPPLLNTHITPSTLVQPVFPYDNLQILYNLSLSKSDLFLNRNLNLECQELSPAIKHKKISLKKNLKTNTSDGFQFQSNNKRRYSRFDICNIKNLENEEHYSINYKTEIYKMVTFKTNITVDFLKDIVYKTPYCYILYINNINKLDFQLLDEKKNIITNGITVILLNTINNSNIYKIFFNISTGVAKIGEKKEKMKFKIYVFDGNKKLFKTPPFLIYSRKFKQTN